MKFDFDMRPSDSPLVETVWRTQSVGGGSFISTAASRWEMVVTKQKGKTTFSIRGPETKASPAPIPEDANFLGIIFKQGAFMPHIPKSDLVNDAVHLIGTSGNSFWLQGRTWEIPDFENADTFVDRLVRAGILVHEPIMNAVHQGQSQSLSLRTVQYRFLRSTGLSQRTIRQIERARYAAALLKQGVSIFDTVCEAGYSDQPHLTRSLKHFIGHTPAEIPSTPIIAL
jgi:hypothetical protein